MYVVLAIGVCLLLLILSCNVLLCMDGIGDDGRIDDGMMTIIKKIIVLKI